MVEIETPVPEGTEVVVLVPGAEPPFELNDAATSELADRLLEADRGDTVPAERVLERLGSRR
jgi:hypothetical protein